MSVLARIDIDMSSAVSYRSEMGAGVAWAELGGMLTANDRIPGYYLICLRLRS